MNEKAFLIQLIDFTRLNEQDTEESIVQFCQKALNAPTLPATICLYPQWLSIAKQTMQKAERNIKLATVLNFPNGNETLSSLEKTMENPTLALAEEWDIVWPYQIFLANDDAAIKNFLNIVREKSKGKILKIILETGAIQDKEKIYQAACLCIEANVNFIKTSTGKIQEGATLAAATAILSAIKKLNPNVGFKASGGIRTFEEAMMYINLADEVLGSEWITPQNFRIGASQLLDALLAKSV